MDSRPVADSHEHGNETYSSSDEELLDSLKGHQFLKISFVAQHNTDDSTTYGLIMSFKCLKIARDKYHIEPGLLETLPDWNKLPSLCK
jgi:hypothetical protein